MKSYSEIIKDDIFRVDDEYMVKTNEYKMCWGCETKHKSGHMVYDASKMRRIFFCENCFTKLKNDS
jgi:hypothetical protein